MKISRFIDIRPHFLWGERFLLDRRNPAQTASIRECPKVRRRGRKTGTSKHFGVSGRWTLASINACQRSSDPRPSILLAYSQMNFKKLLARTTPSFSEAVDLRNSLAPLWMHCQTMLQQVGVATLRRHGAQDAGKRTFGNSLGLWILVGRVAFGRCLLAHPSCVKCQLAASSVVAQTVLLVVPEFTPASSERPPQQLCLVDPPLVQASWLFA